VTLEIISAVTTLSKSNILEIAFARRRISTKRKSHTGYHLNCKVTYIKSDNISETVQDRDTVTTDL